MELLHLLLAFVLTITSSKCSSHHSPSIIILSDFSEQSDEEFFTSIYPWIIENIGAYVSVQYYFNSVDKETELSYCVLQQLDTNSQADYLKCVSENNTFEDCTEDFDLNKKKFKKCLKKIYKIEDEAEEAFDYYDPDTTPFIVVGGKICDPNPQTLLKCICHALFKTKMPKGCKKPSPLTTTPGPTTSTTPTTPKTTQKPTTTEKPSTTENPTTTEKPTTSEKSTITEKPTTTTKPTTTAKPTTTEKPATREKTKTTQDPITTHKPTTPEKPTTTVNPSTTTTESSTTSKQAKRNPTSLTKLPRQNRTKKYRTTTMQPTTEGITTAL